MRLQTITVTEEHVLLLQELNVRWSDYAYDGAPEVDPKRPYGNSDVWRDIAEVLDWKLTEDAWGDEVLTKEQAQRAHELHREMGDVLQVLVQNPTDFKPGVYHNVSPVAPYGVLYRREDQDA